MTDGIQVSDLSRSGELLIATNRGGNRIFGNLREVHEFAATTSEDLALLTAIIEDTNIDPAFAMQTLGLVNDLAFQLQQAVALTFKTKESASNRDPAKREADHG